MEKKETFAERSTRTVLEQAKQIESSREIPEDVKTVKQARLIQALLIANSTRERQS